MIIEKLISLFNFIFYKVYCYVNYCGYSFKKNEIFCIYYLYNNGLSEKKNILKIDNSYTCYYSRISFKERVSLASTFFLFNNHGDRINFFFENLIKKELFNYNFYKGDKKIVDVIVFYYCKFNYDSFFNKNDDFNYTIIYGIRGLKNMNGNGYTFLKILYRNIFFNNIHGF